MIKHFVNWIKAWIGVKDEEMDPHAELYLKGKESDVPVYKNEEAVSKGHCDDHSKYKHRCPKCKEAIA